MAAKKPRITLSIKERDLGLGHLLREAAKLRKKPFVKVGVTQAKGSKLHEDERTKKSVKTVADIAQIHEEGAPGAGIPQRSFIGSTVYKNQAKYDSHIEQLKDKIFNPASGMTTERALGLIGQEVSADIKNTIRAGIEPPLKESTIRQKNAGKIAEAQGRVNAGGSNKKDLNLIATGGASTPLIDTAQLVNSISYETVLSGEGAK